MDYIRKISCPIVNNSEYARFVSAVNTNYARFKDRKFAYIVIDDMVYYFRNYEFGDYEILEIGELK